jgi:hypothetical protein
VATASPARAQPPPPPPHEVLTFELQPTRHFPTKVVPVWQSTSIKHTFSPERRHDASSPAATPLLTLLPQVDRRHGRLQQMAMEEGGRLRAAMWALEMEDRGEDVEHV